MKELRFNNWCQSKFNLKMKGQAILLISLFAMFLTVEGSKTRMKALRKKSQTTFMQQFGNEWDHMKAIWDQVYYELLFKKII